MYCTNCGKEIDDKAVMCVHCGVLTTSSPSIVSGSSVILKPSYEKESFIMNATAGSLLMWLLLQVVIVFAISFVGAFLYIAFTSPYAMNNFLYDTSISETFTSIATLATTIGSSIFTVLIFKSMLKIKLPSMTHANMSILRILYYAAIGIGISTIFSYGVSFLDNLLSMFNLHMTTPDFAMSNDITNNILLILTTCIAAPIFEELLFRGLILTALKRFGNMFAIIITSLLFALAHGNLPQSIPVFFMSLVLCYVALRSKSLLPVIAIHFINNSIAMLQTYFIGIGSNWIIFLIIDIALIAFVVCALFIKRKQIANYLKKHKGTPLLSYYKHWAPIVFTLISLLLIVLSFSDIYST